MNHLGKTITQIDRECIEIGVGDRGYDRLTISFSDGSQMRIESSDFEGYMSSLLIDEEIDAQA